MIHGVEQKRKKEDDAVYETDELEFEYNREERGQGFM